MSLSLWMLLAYAGWTLTVLVAGVGIGRWSLILAGRAKLNDFPGDTPHGTPAYRRAVRAHANCIENLPVFGAIVLIAAAARLAPPGFDELAVATVVARMAQSSVHMLLAETATMVAWRFTFFSVQLLAMFAMGIQVAAQAA
jgi:uncharacterized MAPEG superfamily protein